MGHLTSAQRTSPRWEGGTGSCKKKLSGTRTKTCQETRVSSLITSSVSAPKGWRFKILEEGPKSERQSWRFNESLRKHQGTDRIFPTVSLKTWGCKNTRKGNRRHPVGQNLPRPRQAQSGGGDPRHQPSSCPMCGRQAGLSPT